MKEVQTVTGSVSVEEFGFTLMHEHLVTSSMGIPENYPQLYIDGAFDVVVKDLKEMKANGIQTVVEASTIDLGRDVKMMKKASEATGVYVVACTGWWQEFSPLMGNFSADKFASLFVDDLTKGVGGTDIKAGILKAAMDKEGPTPARETLHRAVARASLQTGTPIMLHSYPQTEMGRHQLRILKEEGVDMKRVKVDHCPETTDMDYILWLADQGCWLGIDRLPIILMPGQYAVKSETRIKTIKKMIDAGLSDRMLFSHDYMSVSTLFDTLPPQDREYVDSINKERFLYLQKIVFKTLVEMGVSEDLLTRMCVDNPRRFFEGC